MDLFKPCPFCGGRKMEVVVDAHGEVNNGYVRCTQCGARGPILSAYYRQDTDGLKTIAVESWNRRTYDV